MSTELELGKVKAKTAAEICARFRLKEPALALLSPEQTPSQFLARLLTERQWAAAIRLLAYALPKREAVWWGCVSLRLAAQTSAAQELAALRAAVHWCVHPSDEHRYASQAASLALAHGEPARLVADAAFKSGGSLAPPGARPMPPQPTMTARLVSAALLMAAAGKPADMVALYRQFLALGIAIAQGKYSWIS
ncbi:MAG: hypothetical protein AB7K24_11685 [Gemmataceae bacterium]